MKRSILLLLICLCLGTAVLSCSNESINTPESEMTGTLSAENASLREYFSTPSFTAMVRSHNIDVRNINLGSVIKNSYVEYLADSYIIPVVKEGQMLGNIVVGKHHQASLFCDVYINMSDLKESSTFSISFSNGSKAVDYSVEKEKDKYALTIRKVYENHAAGKGETYRQCFSRVFATAKRACDNDNGCKTFCAIVDINPRVPGACTASMAAAAAAACAIYRNKGEGSGRE